MSKTDEQLRRVISASEFRSELGAWAIVIGLILEIGLALAFPEKKSFIENWGPVGATGLIALGVYAEIHFGRRTSAAHSELQRRSEERVAEANASAAKAQKEAAEARKRAAELERLTSWRRVEPEQRAKIAVALRDKLPLTAEQQAHGKIHRNEGEAVILDPHIEAADDIEAILFANQIKQIFDEVRTNFPVHLLISNTSHFGHIIFGLHAASVPPEYADVVREVFSDAGAPMPENADLTKVFLNRMTHASHPAPKIWLYVGHKPRD